MMRSVRADVRNPILRLPEIAQLQALDDTSKAALVAVLAGIQRESRALAEKSWRTHKAPMAAYWKAVAVYANHISRALRTPVLEVVK